MKIHAGLLAQLEKCGLSAQLSTEHDETSESAERSRLIRTEVTRAFHVQDQDTIPEAEAALAWLRSQLELCQAVAKVGEPIDLVDPETGEVLVSGRPGAVLILPNLVVAWKTGDPRGIGEPEDDLGLIAMGLACFGGEPFQTAYVAFQGLEAFPRRSPVFEPAGHAGLMARIKAAAGRPPVACPGDWCGACRQRLYCQAWKARTELALTVLPVEAKSLDITNENAPALWMRIKAVEEACELAKDQLKGFVRAGGRLEVDGKEYYLGQSEGRETADVKALKAAGLMDYIKKGDPFERAGWRKIKQETT
jgi:hypothetical protein